MKQIRINWSAALTEVVAGLLLVALTPFVGRALALLVFGLMLGFLFQVILDMAMGGSSLTQIASILADSIQSR